MEATAKYDFHTTDVQELAFRKNDILVIRDMEADQNWYEAALRDRQGMVPNNYIEMADMSWYAGRLSRSEAANFLLMKKPNGDFVHPHGAFLVRRSANSDEDTIAYSISMRSNSEVLNFRIIEEKYKYRVWSERFNSINELIRFYRDNSLTRNSQVYLANLACPPPVPSTNQPASKPNNEQQQHQQQNQSQQQQQQTQQQSRQPQLVRALFPFQATNDDELSFKKNEIIEVLGEEEQNWMIGRIGASRRGVFPINYVESIPN